MLGELPADATRHLTEVRMLTVEVFSGPRPCHRQGGHAGSDEEVGYMRGAPLRV